MFFVAGCQPGFTSTPGNQNNKKYVIVDDSSVRLDWDYNPDGRTVREVDLLYNQGGVAVTVARWRFDPPAQNLQVNAASGYNSSRVEFSPRATFIINNIVASDSRTFACKVSFTSFDPPDISSSVELVVVGKYPYQYYYNNKRLFVAFTWAVNSLKARETPKQAQICIKKHKNVKLQDTHNLAKGSQKHVQMMMQSPNDYVFSFPEPAWPCNHVTNKKNPTANLDLGPLAQVINIAY